MRNRQRSQHSRQRHPRPTFQLTIALAAVTCTLALAACGSSTTPTGTTASNLSSRLAFAKCMRSNGVPNFPDGPSIPDGVAQSPAFLKVAHTCRSKLQPGGGPHAGISESTRLSLLHHAECMRAHGVSNYPDPNLPSHGPYDFGPPPGINTDAPAFQRAASACGGP